MQTTSLRSITQLSYLVFGIVDTRSDRSQQFSIVFGVYRTCMIGDDSSLSFFGIDHTCTIGHIVILSSSHHRPYPIRQVPIIQFCFRRRSDLCDPSHQCIVQFLLKTVPYLISHNSSVSFFTQTCSIRSITQLAYLFFVTIDTRFDRSRQFSMVFYIDHTYIIGHVLSYLVFITYYTWFDQSRQFSIIFLRRPYLYGRSHRYPVCFLSLISPHPIDHDNQFHFLRRPDLYDLSCRCPISFSSQIVPSSIGHDSLVLFLM